MTDAQNPAGLIETSESLPFGDFEYDPASRTLKGILLPFGEKSRMSVSGADPIEFGAESITLPRDPSVVTLNRHHNRHDPVGRATVLEKRSEGVYFEAVIADTDEGDEYLTAQRGSLKKVSAEVRDLVRNGAFAVSAVLTGAALVAEGAFASAALFELAPAGEDTPDSGETTPEPSAATTPAEDPTEEKDAEVMTSIVPDQAGVDTPAARTDVNALFAAIATGEGRENFSNLGDMFAIASIQDSGPSSVTIGADVRTPQALGELWKRNPYSRKFASLINHQDLTSTRAYGWRWVTEPAVGDYAGNTAEVPSTAVDTEPVTVDAQRIAGGNKLDRRFIDFKDQSVIESFLRLQTESYARVSDGKALTALVAGSTASNIGAAVSGVDDSLTGLVDGALNVINSENTPSFAIVSPELWRKLITTPKDKVFEFLNAGFGLEEGSAAGFRIVPGAVGTGKVLVGAKEAATFFELPGAPIRVEGLDVLHGATDIAVFGYYASIINNAAALSLVNTVRA